MRTIPAGFVRQADGSYSKAKIVTHENHNQSKSAIVERAAVDESLAQNKNQTRHSRKLAVIVTSFRRRLLDEDNLAGKYHIDALRYAGIIPNDSPDKVTISMRQQKVATEAEERTEIEIKEA